MTPGPVPRRVAVIGTGLIGTSAALALRRLGTDVRLWDRDPAAAALAADLGAGRVLSSLDSLESPADLALIAVPPADVAAVLSTAQRAALADCYTDVASVKALPLAQARDAGCDISRYVPGHPLAGRERSGPAAARADLFLGRAWALCPAAETSGEAMGKVAALVRACGAELVVTDAETHDRWVALVSHAPHVVAAAMAARLAPDSVPAEALGLAGQGLRDATRIAVGDVDLWTQILTGNAASVTAVLAEVAASLTDITLSLAEIAENGSPASPAPKAGPAGAGPAGAGPAGASAAAAGQHLAALLEQGRAGVARIPGKHGGPARAFTAVQVVISDRPGELARLFTTAAEADVNIEDVGIEHSPGQPVGVAELSVRPESADTLIAALAAGGWPVRR
ncbi:MAG: prephenate dehydrogenase [Streptosporangiaceae bacterium]